MQVQLYKWSAHTKASTEIVSLSDILCFGIVSYGFFRIDISDILIIFWNKKMKRRGRNKEKKARNMLTEFDKNGFLSWRRRWWWKWWASNWCCIDVERCANMQMLYWEYDKKKGYLCAMQHTLIYGCCSLCMAKRYLLVLSIENLILLYIYVYVYVSMQWLYNCITFNICSPLRSHIFVAFLLIVFFLKTCKSWSIPYQCSCTASAKNQVQFVFY